jgi:hypothetical protein
VVFDIESVRPCVINFSHYARDSFVFRVMPMLSGATFSQDEVKRIELMIEIGMYPFPLPA